MAIRASMASKSASVSRALAGGATRPTPKPAARCARQQRIGNDGVNPAEGAWRVEMSARHAASPLAPFAAIRARRSLRNLPALSSSSPASLRYREGRRKARALISRHPALDICRPSREVERRQCLGKPATRPNRTSRGRRLPRKAGPLSDCKSRKADLSLIGSSRLTPGVLCFASGIRHPASESRKALAWSRTAKAASDSGTMWALPRFLWSAGMAQSRPAKSNSSQAASRTSWLRLPVRMRVRAPAFCMRILEDDADSVAHLTRRFGHLLSYRQQHIDDVRRGDSSGGKVARLWEGMALKGHKPLAGIDGFSSLPHSRYDIGAPLPGMSP